MRDTSRIALLTALIATSLASASQDSAPILIPPLIIQRPEGSSWQIIRQNDNGVVFQRSAVDAVWAVASVQGFEPRSSDDPAEFLTEVKRSAASQFEGVPNTKLVGYTLKPTGDRGYPCVIVRSTIEVIGPQSSESRPPDRRQGRILFCHAPGKAHIGFAVGFTYAAENPQPANESEADAFLNGVRLTK